MKEKNIGLAEREPNPPFRQEVMRKSQQNMSLTSLSSKMKQNLPGQVGSGQGFRVDSVLYKPVVIGSVTSRKCQWVLMIACSRVLMNPVLRDF